MSDNQYHVMISEDEQALFEFLEGEAADAECVVANSEEDAARADEATNVPGKGAAILPPKSSEKPGMLISPMRRRETISAAARCHLDANERADLARVFKGAVLKGEWSENLQ
jgi:hypothetical protein